MPATRILIVDDDPKFLHFVTEVLIGAGYDALGVSEPDKVHETAKAWKPRLVILDVRMPGKDGFEVARELRADPATGAARVMFLTGDRATSRVKNARAAGGVAYLEKPVKTASLLWMVKALLAGPPGTKKAKAL